jgi:uncharacterized membrane-anchored protein YhcB (DUF1043 family)
MKTEIENDKEDLLTRMENKIDVNQKKAEANQEDLLARMGQQTKDLLSHISQSTQNLRTELTEAIQKTQIELQTVEVSIDKRTRCVEEDIEAIREYITASYACYSTSSVLRSSNVMLYAANIMGKVPCKYIRISPAYVYQKYAGNRI